MVPDRNHFLYVKSVKFRLQFRTGSNQFLTCFVTSELSEVLDETTSQVFCFFIPLSSVSVSVTRIKDLRINTRQFCRNNEIEVRNNLSRSLINRAIQNSIDDTTSIADRDTFTSTVPTSVNLICFSTSLFHLLNQFFSILSRMQ